LVSTFPHAANDFVLGGGVLVVVNPETVKKAAPNGERRAMAGKEGIMVEQAENWSRTGPRRRRVDGKYLILLASPTGFEPVLSP
jgi:hypothetical protein